MGLKIGMTIAACVVFAAGHVTAAPGDLTRIAGPELVDEPYGILVDAADNVFVADRELHKVFRIDANGITSTVAGSGSTSFVGDGGPATDAGLWEPHHIGMDGAGNLYIADARNGFVRKVDASGTITSVAGADFFAATSTFDDSVPATDRILFLIRGLFVDNDANIYVDEGFLVSKIDGAGGIIRTIAGNGNDGDASPGAVATESRLNFPEQVFVDHHNRLFIAERNADRVLMVDMNEGIPTITVIAGSGSPGSSGDGGQAVDAELDEPYGLYVTGNDQLLIADRKNHCVRKVDLNTGIITTIAGTGTAGTAGEGGPATQAQLDGPRNVWVAQNGDLYISDLGSSRVLRVESDGSLLPSPVAGVGDGSTGGFVAGGGPTSGGNAGGDPGPVSALGTLLFDQATQGTLSGPSEVFSMTLDSEAEVTISLNSDFDAVLHLFSGNSAADTTNSNQIEAADGFFIGTETITRTLAPGSYIVMVRSFSGDTGAYTLTAEGGTNAGPGDGGSAPGVVALESSTAGTITDVETFHTLTLSSQSPVFFTLNSDIDGVLHVYSGEGSSKSLIYTADIWGISEDAERFEDLLAPGTYTIGVVAFNAGESGSYTVGVTATGEPHRIDQPGGGPSDALPEITHNERDIYLIPVTSAGELSIDVETTSLDVVIELYAGGDLSVLSGDPVASRDGSFTGTESIRQTVDPGDFLLVIRPFTPGDTGTYALNVAGPVGTGGSTGSGGGLAGIGTHEGTLSGFEQFHDFSLSATQPVFMTLQSDIDVVLNLYLMIGSDAINVLSLDEAVSFPETFANVLPDGDYRVGVIAFNTSESGAYTLDLQSEGVLPTLDPVTGASGRISSTEDEIFVLDVPEQSDVTINVETNWDVVVRLLSGGTIESMLQFDANTIASADSRISGTETISETLEPGQYLVVISAFDKFVGRGEYVLTVEGLSAPTAGPDFDMDGEVGFGDFLLFAAAFGSSQGDANYNALFDLDGDNEIGFGDFLQFAGQFGTTVAQPATKRVARSLFEAGPALELVTRKDADDLVSVTVARSDAKATFGYGFDLRYDATVMEVVGAASADASLFGADVAILETDQPGVARVGDAFAANRAEGDLVTVQFRLLDPTAVGRVEVADAFVSDGKTIGRVRNAVSAELRAIPTEYALDRNFPNPFNPETTIAYALPEAGHVKLTVYNTVGQEIRTLARGQHDAGYYRLRWDGRDAVGRSVASGVYLYRIVADGFVKTNRMMLTK